MRLAFRNIEVKGEENLDALPPDRHVIFAPTHLSDSDVPLTIAEIGKRFHVAVGDASTHHKATENTSAWLANQVVGPDNFYPVQHEKNEEGFERGSFDPEDFEAMQKAFEEDKAIVLSAYFRSGHGWELPPKGGYGAVYLADRADALIVPVAVNVRSEKQVGMGGIASSLTTALRRPGAEISIGMPLDLPKIEGLERMGEMLKKRKAGGSLSPEEKEEFRRLSEELRARSNALMEKLAEMLPEERRGKWKKKK